MSTVISCRVLPRALLVAVATALCSSVPSVAQDRKTDKGAQSAQTQEMKGKKADAKTDSIIVLVPHIVVMDENYANGCWIRLYEDENFRGDFVSLVGPADVVSLRTGLFNFGRKWESAVVGPRATVAAYDNENFQQKVANFKPGQRVPDLDPKLGFFENIRSMRISCSK